MPSCFVIMGFGPKTDLETGRVLDLDKSYKNIIKPAIKAAGYDCVRADEIQHSGVIDVPMYEMLNAADLVVADLLTANLNAVFELGVRHALKPRQPPGQPRRGRAPGKSAGASLAPRPWWVLGQRGHGETETPFPCNSPRDRLP
jgi:hypothetical protein